ncbi:hypothetical protein [Tellurirhabdus rosea]|uniref:hypothetical protein n=1 Tax=Tellurirhabdus rosea TaxID=2674997 RepID=UPI00224D2DF0|nr:hypothetical protein [Tellurirhabdus rosea]
MLSRSTAYDPLSIDRRLSSVSFYTYLLLLSLCGGLVASLYLKGGHLWLDEIFSLFLIQDPSLGHMNEAVFAGVETSPPLFYFLYWALGHYVSPDPLFLKAVSIGFFLASIVILFVYTNQLIRNSALNFLLFITVLCFTDLDFLSSCQIRPYSVNLLLSCVHFIIIHQLISQPAKPALLLVQMLTGLCLVFIQNIGLLTISIPACLFIGLFWWSGRKEYLFPILSMLMVFAGWALIWYDGFLIQASLERLNTADSRQSFASSFQVLGALIPTVTRLEGNSPWIAGLRVFLMTGILFYILIKQFNFQKLTKDPVFGFYFLSGFIFILTILLVVLANALSIAVLSADSLWPVHLLVIFQIVYAVHFFRRHFRIDTRYTFYVVIYTLLLSFYLFNKNINYGLQAKSSLTAVTKGLGSYPVLCESMDTFLPIAQHNLGDVRLLLNQRSPVVGKKALHKRLQLFYRKYPAKVVVLPEEITSRTYGHFYVLDEASAQQFESLTAKGKFRITRVQPTEFKDVRLLECVYN